MDLKMRQPLLPLLLLGVPFITTSACAEDPVSFRRQVMAVLSRGGCNQGTCHGNLNGKGGFKLSLRGQDPEKDYIALTREPLARRIDRQSPDESLLVQKAT